MQERFNIKKIQSKFGFKSQQFVILISVSKQKLYLVKGEKVIRQYPVSTSKYGIGSKKGSNKTPLGVHCIVNKIGRNAKIGEIFKSRRRTGKIVKVKNRNVQRDVITTRILRLKGLERGINKGKGIDSYKRCIYIHGTAEEHLIGKPASHGCIRMKNREIIELFNLVKRGTLVYIQTGTFHDLPMD